MYLSTMFYMKQVASVPCSFTILHVSGTLILIQQQAIDWDRRFFLKEQAEAEKQGIVLSLNVVCGRNSFFFSLYRQKL